ncbi:glyoxylase-like metal-dependent hydrolase (beta-lactamase superfamily II) [Haloactinospora alba]|uniref:Glyoxylase-like metal-dependent hydrolase (Beta-lactamase superfamily II) n=1 Tax=Haloactinospora alba TaxID=405555 RepID=A0A543NA35_9ACTN|nr:MBL fold metallo-hydrolase [Haloactinospora alba]TQN28694.1 glyoxylase-like metal-dependent hydrolase (beta-lactamase superfamily II) [Haloactinospora alba]
MQIDGYATRHATCVLCPNPGPMTLDGTNTWVVRDPDTGDAAVVDPGPRDEEHLRRVARTAGERLAVTLVTHHHPDHTDGLRYFRELTGAPVRAVDAAHCDGGAVLRDGETVPVGGLRLRVLATPGHTSDSACFHLPEDDAVLTGDTVLGRGTTVLADSAGLAGYMRSLYRLRDLVDSAGVSVLLPGHGPACSEPWAKLTSYVEHREERLSQVAEAVRAGAREPADVVARVYTDLDPQTRPAAEWSVRAQLRYLAERGDIPAAAGET